jgi:osmotically-inducible protein OsmY
MVERFRIVRFLACLAFAPAFFGCAATQKHESTGEYVDDSVLTTKVKAAILDEATLKTLQINVETFKGVVQLSGFVDSVDHAARAGEVAARIQGVKEVKNDLVAK